MQLILSPRKSVDSDQLAEAAVRRGWRVVRLASWRIPEGFETQSDLAIHGEGLFARIVAAQCGRVLLEPGHDWLARLPMELTRRRVQTARFADVKGIAYPAFVKPPDDKIFPAQVYDSAEALLEYQRLQHIPDDHVIIVSDAVHFRKEFRAHLLHGEIVSLSRYCMDGELSPDAKDDDCQTAKSFAAEVARQAVAFTPPSVVIDVGLLDTGCWAVIEANPAFGSGIYDGDADRILDVLLHACRLPSEQDPSLDQFKFPVIFQ